MHRKIGSVLVKLFDYEEIVNIYANICKVVTVLVYIIVITGIPLIDYTNMNQVGLLTFRLTTMGVILLLSMLITRDLAKVALRIERRKKEFFNIRVFYLVVALMLLIATFYFVSIYI
ncbi:MAG: hypothetical protein QXS24_02015 [Desulfurococcaceae archaeon]